MMGRWFAFFLAAAAALAVFFMPRAHSQQLPCVAKTPDTLSHPFGNDLLAQGNGKLADGATIRLSINSSREFVIAIEPSDQPLICLVVAGDDWKFQLPERQKANR